MSSVLDREVPTATVEPRPIDGEPDRVRQIRAQAAARFNTLGWPTTRLEEWKYTSLAPLTRLDWKSDQRHHEVPADAASPFGDKSVAELMFVNGVLHADRSSLANEHPGIRIKPLSKAMESDAFTQHFARYADYETHALTAMNTALWQDGAFIELAPGTQLEGFIHLFYLGGGAAANPVASQIRNLIVAGRGSQLTVVESFFGKGTYFTNTVTEIVAGDGAVVDHHKFEYESLDAFHIGTVQIHQERSSNVTSRTFALGGALVRNEVNVALTGEGASLSMEGLFVLNGKEHVDNHTVIDHVSPHCDSVELFKGILDDNARGIFDGRIIVEPNAVKTNSRQTNRNLLLSETAIIDSKPTLEIHNDDVKCNHGSTIGQLDEEALFYLRSRGIDEVEARNLLVYAFASEIVERIKIDAVREGVGRALFSRMRGRLPERREEER
ncbi:MAG: Fe-S cluster assembly protein SufD [Thermoanaerobaculia bacterium]|jgi:Fe-S cluster assembly protein SufD|nr:Fe-S cluster assembly protein SufD [Thermoanaerobaculia bacterium]